MTDPLPVPTSPTGRPHLLLIGGGHAHIQVFRDFERRPPDCRITVLVDRPVAMYSGMVPGFVAGQYTREELSLDVRDWASRLGAEYIEGRATGIDAEARVVQRAAGDPIAYDLCSWNIGSTVHGLQVPGVREYALATRPIGGFVDRVHGLLEAAVTRTAGRSREPLRLVVVGGGAAGVELALCMEQRAQAAGVRQVDVQVVHSSAGLLPGSARSLRRRIEREFQRRGVGHHGGERVTEVREDAVVLEGGTSFGADLVVWVTGAASHLDASLGGPLTRQGWIPVGDTLQHVEHAGVFAAGDCAQLVDHPDLPKAGVYSVRMGPVLSHNLRAAASAGDGVMKSYHPQDDFLALLNLGDGRAAGSKWGRSFSGRWVMRWKDRIDRAFVSRYR